MSRKNQDREFVSVDRSLDVEGHLKALKLDRAFEYNLISWNPPIKKGSGSYEVTVELLTLGEDMTSAETEEMIATKEDYRFALPEETMAHCAKYPNLQRETPILCFGAFWVGPFDSRYVLVLDEYAGGRRARLNWDGPDFPRSRYEPRDVVSKWFRRYRVAVVRKQLLIPLSTRHLKYPRTLPRVR